MQLFRKNLGCSKERVVIVNTEAQFDLKTNDKIKISIIIPHYNRKALLIECLDSIASNDYPQEFYEVIVVDDCSTENIDDIRSYSKIKNYRVYQLGMNSGGASIPRNFGLNSAAGEYALFIDSDDTISKGFLSKTISIAEEGNCDSVIVKKISERTSAEGFKYLTEDIIKIDIDNAGEFDGFIFSDNYSIGKLFRMEVIKRFGIRFPENLKKSEDSCFCKWFWAVSNTAGLCASESYLLKDAVEGNLSQVKMEHEDGYEHIFFILRTIFSVPDEFAPLSKKARILNVRIKRRYVLNLLESPYYVNLLKEKCGAYFKAVRDLPQIKDAARNFIDTVIGFSEEKNIFVQNILSAGDEWIKVDASRDFSGITIAGDTYFGEWYTRKRRKIGKSDALQEYGYSYSFEKAAPFLPGTDYNIVNFEAVLTEGLASSGKEQFAFILDASPVETIKELKHRNINAVMLANNHSMDFGEITGKRSRRLFLEDGLRTVGFGETLEDAERPLLLECAGRQVILFNAYWFRRRRQEISNHYAGEDNAGTACLSDSLFNRISEYREKYPEAFIILSPHWGDDFEEPGELQKELAAKAITAGSDCIIGHGSQIVSEYEWIQGKFVIYSIGNFVFNSDGTPFIENNKPKFAYVSKLLINKDSVRLRLYPIAAYNPETFWQPHPVTEKQFNELLQARTFKTEMIMKDELGHYLEVIL